MERVVDTQSRLKSTDTAQPTKLYALLLKLRPLARGTLMPFSGELVHGAWMNWLRESAPEVAQQLHEGNRRRLFTCSSLQFPFTMEHRVQAQRENVHLPLDPQKSYFVRLTLLHGDLFPLLYSMVMEKKAGTASDKQQPFMQIGKQSFALEEVISTPDDPSGWTGFTTCETMVEQAKTRRLLPAQPLEVEFASLTTFNRIHNSTKLFGKYYARLPLPSYVFGSLANRWHEIAPPALTHVIQRERLEAYIEADGVVIDDYQLQAHTIHFAEYTQRGFIGTCRYLLRGPEDPLTAQASLTLSQQLSREKGAWNSSELGILTLRQQILLLSWLAFYTGVGYKPTMGMGQMRAV